MIAKVAVGAAIPPTSWGVTQEKINAWAEASTDFNPLHLDPAFGKTTPFGGTIAHGHYSLALVSEAMTSWLGDGWTSHGSWNVTFIRPVRPGDTVTVTGTVTAARSEGGKTIAECELSCVNQKGEPVMVGTAAGAI